MALEGTPPVTAGAEIADLRGLTDDELISLTLGDNFNDPHDALDSLLSGSEDTPTDAAAQSELVRRAAVYQGFIAPEQGMEAPAPDIPAIAHYLTTRSGFQGGDFPGHFAEAGEVLEGLTQPAPTEAERRQLRSLAQAILWAQDNKAAGSSETSTPAEGASDGQ